MAWASELPSGRWRGGYRDEQNRVRHVPGTFANKRAAKKAASDEETDIRRGDWVDPNGGKILTGTAIEEWWSNRSREKSTLQADRSRVNNYLLPRWENAPLGKITVAELNKWVRELRAKGLSDWTVRRIMSLLSQVFDTAMAEGKVKRNPCDSVTVDAPKGNDYIFYSEDELTSITAEMTPQWALVTWVLAWTGLRWGELAGLHVRQVDLTRAVIVVQHSLVQLTGNAFVKEYPKDDEPRSVPIPEIILPWLVEHMGALEKHNTCPLTHFRGRKEMPCRGGGLVFRDGANGWISRFYFGHDVWHRALPLATRTRVKAGKGAVPKGRPYDLRHFYASWLVTRGVPLYDVQQLMGHRDPRTTAGYAHLAPQTAHERALKALNRKGVALRRPTLRGAARVAKQVSTAGNGGQPGVAREAG